MQPPTKETYITCKKRPTKETYIYCGRRRIFIWVGEWTHTQLKVHNKSFGMHLYLCHWVCTFICQIMLIWYAPNHLVCTFIIIWYAPLFAKSPNHLVCTFIIIWYAPLFARSFWFAYQIMTIILKSHTNRGAYQIMTSKLDSSIRFSTHNSMYMWDVTHSCVWHGANHVWYEVAKMRRMP